MGASFPREKLLSVATGLSSLPSNMPSSSYSGCCVAKHPQRPWDPGRLHWASPNLRQEEWAQTGPMSQTRRPLWSFTTSGGPRGRPWGTGAGSEGGAAPLRPPSHLSATTRSALPSLVAASGAACAARSLLWASGTPARLWDILTPAHLVASPGQGRLVAQNGKSWALFWGSSPATCLLHPLEIQIAQRPSLCCPQETFSQSWGHCSCHNWEREVLWHLVGGGQGGC